MPGALKDLELECGGLGSGGLGRGGNGGGLLLHLLEDLVGRRGL